MLLRLNCRNLSTNVSLWSTNKIKDLLDGAASGIEKNVDSSENAWSKSPYPPETVFEKRDQGKKTRRTLKDPRDTSIILFPGQGSQYVGMAKNLIKIPEARDMFSLASEVLG